MGPTMDYAAMVLALHDVVGFSHVTAIREIAAIRPERYHKRVLHRHPDPLDDHQVVVLCGARILAKLGEPSPAAVGGGMGPTASQGTGEAEPGGAQPPSEEVDAFCSVMAGLQLSGRVVMAGLENCLQAMTGPRQGFPDGFKWSQAQELQIGITLQQISNLFPSLEGQAGPLQNREEPAKQLLQKQQLQALLQKEQLLQQKRQKDRQRSQSPPTCPSGRRSLLPGPRGLDVHPSRSSRVFDDQPDERGPGTETGGRCGRCGRPGHTAAGCWARMDGGRNKSPPANFRSEPYWAHAHPVPASYPKDTGPGSVSAQRQDSGDARDRARVDARLRGDRSRSPTRRSNRELIPDRDPRPPNIGSGRWERVLHQERARAIRDPPHLKRDSDDRYRRERSPWRDDRLPRNSENYGRLSPWNEEPVHRSVQDTEGTRQRARQDAGSNPGCPIVIDEPTGHDSASTVMKAQPSSGAAMVPGLSMGSEPAARFDPNLDIDPKQAKAAKSSNMVGKGSNMVGKSSSMATSADTNTSMVTGTNADARADADALLAELKAEIPYRAGLARLPAEEKHHLDLAVDVPSTSTDGLGKNTEKTMYSASHIESLMEKVRKIPPIRKLKPRRTALDMWPDLPPLEPGTGSGHPRPSEPIDRNGSSESSAMNRNYSTALTASSGHGLAGSGATNAKHSVESVGAHPDAMDLDDTDDKHKEPAADPTGDANPMMTTEGADAQR